ncbi:MAG: insulinase family protein [Verrucomicrobiae bacterium]|jgi:zinc protease|nr:insulinase family protein [Verrucomicrobiae bacterium]
MFNRSNRRTLAAALGLFFFVAATGNGLTQAIPDRPEKLTFPPLKFEPPEPSAHRVELKAGPVVYIVPDRELPLINISISVRTGGYLEPKGKEGLADLAGYLLTKGGTKSWKAEDLDEHVAFLAARLGSSIGDTSGDVSVNLLSKDLDEGLKILREVLTVPSFESEKLQLRREQLLQSMKQRNDDPRGIERRERYRLVYGDDFFLNRLSTKASLESITPEDLHAFHRRWFVPANFVVAVNGDFDREKMLAKLETLFAKWPFQGEVPPAIPSEYTMAKPGVYLVEKDVPQGRVNVVMPGIHRDDPDFFASQIMNDILGGGGFTSRIMNRVRSDEGLAYSAGSALPGGIHYPQYFIAGFQSKSMTVAYATSIVMEELRRIATAPVTDEELDTAKKSFIETFPQAFATKGQVASIFADGEMSGRFAKHPDYWKTYRARMEKVTADDVRRVAQRFMKLDRAFILVVGKKDEILKGHPDHKVRLTDLAKGRLSDVPLRDPLTLEPIKE